MFNKGDIDKWFSKFDSAFDGLHDSIDKAGDNFEKHIEEMTSDLTPTLTRALINSRKIEQYLSEDDLEIVITYNEDGSAPYAIEQHEMPYSHDYEHNPPEVRKYTGGEPLLYLYKPLIEEREKLWKKVFSKVGWKK